MRITGDGTAARGRSRLAEPGPARAHPMAGGSRPDDDTGTTWSATAARRPARRPASPTASWTTGRAPDWSEPTVRPAYGSGTQRLYSFRDVVVLKIVKRLLDTGVSLQNIRAAVGHLRTARLARPGPDDPDERRCHGLRVHVAGRGGASCCEGGQGVFGIAVGVVWRDVEATLSELHGERVDTGETLVGHNPADELARRRNRAV